MSFLYIHVDAVSKGSDSVLSLEPSYTFSSSPNQMLTFGFFKNGFVLNDFSTSCTFSSVFPVSGNVSLHGGKLYLGTDCIFQNVATLVSSGEFYGNDHAIDLSSSITGVPAPYEAKFHDATLFLNGDFSLSTTTKFIGNCTVDGRWNNFSLGNGGILIVGHNSSLRLKNLEIGGIVGSNVLCLDDSAQLILDNVRWVQTGDYTFTRGSIQMDNDVNFVGPNSFTYASGLTSTVSVDSAWHLSDVVKLVIGRKRGVTDREPLYLTDDTSIFKMEHCIFSVTSSGMCLTRGTVAMDREVVVTMDGNDATSGLMLGDGTAANDLQIILYPNAVLKLASGWLVNNMTNANNLSTADVPIKYVQAGNSMVAVKQNINYSNVSIAMVGSGGSVVDPGKQLIYNNVSVETPVVDFTVTATRYDPYTMLLAGGGKITITRGMYPLATLVYGTNNIFNGIGILTGPIFVADSTASLTLSLLGTMNTDITLYGGSLALQADLSFGQGYCIAGAGYVDVGSQHIAVNMFDRVLTSTLSFSGVGGSLDLLSNLGLAGPLAFSGYMHINGNNNVLELLGGGSLTILPGSTLHVRNILLDRIAVNNIYCIDDSAKLVLENVTWIQSDDFIFQRGTIDFFNDVDMVGSHTFALQTRFTSTIHDHATLTFDTGFTFSYDAVNAVSDMLAFESKDCSKLLLNSATLYVTRYGMPLKGGVVCVDQQSRFVAERWFNGEVEDMSIGIVIGDNDGNNDCTCIIKPGALLSIDSGNFIYRNTQSTSLHILNDLSTMYVSGKASLILDQSLTFAHGRIQFAPGAQVMRAQGSMINGVVEYIQ